MKRLKNQLKKSFFIVNKLYLFLIFIGLLLEDITLGFYYFILSIIVFIWKTLTAKVPISIDRDFSKDTYIYKKIDNKELKMDIWYPDLKHKKPYPLVYFCHGGGWISGFRNQPNNVSWCKYLAYKGFAIASIDYRYGYKNNMDDILSDYSDGLKYLKKHHIKFCIDKSNITLMGLSAGGHLSLLYSTYHTLNNPKSEFMSGIKSIVAFYPPTDLKDLLDDDNKSLFAKFAIKQTMKENPEENIRSYDYYSPINYVSESMIPTLIVHGKNDNTVPFESSVKFVKKLNKYNVDNRFLIHKKAGHSFDTKLKDYATVSILDKTVRFIRKHLEKRGNYENN